MAKAMSTTHRTICFISVPDAVPNCAHLFCVGIGAALQNRHM